jgi:hypothetical protein
MSTEIKRGRGRPKKETPKYDQPVKVNLTQEQADKLDFLTRKVGMSRNDIMREALDSMYRLMG